MSMRIEVANEYVNNILNKTKVINLPNDNENQLVKSEAVSSMSLREEVANEYISDMFDTFKVTNFGSKLQE
jgi:hypothetical protein